MLGGSGAKEGQQYGVGKQLWDEIGMGNALGLRVTSGFRPGAHTKHGTLSDHARHAAVDMVSGSSVQLALQSAALAGDIVTVAYTKPGSNPLQDVSGNDSLSLVATTVSNQTVAVGARLVNPALRVAIARRSDPTDRRAGVGGGL